MEQVNNSIKMQETCIPTNDSILLYNTYITLALLISIQYSRALKTYLQFFRFS